MRSVLLSLAVLAVFTVSACKAEEETVSLEPLHIVAANGKTHAFRVEVVDTPDRRAIGMMFRKTIKKNFGMLFIFDDTEERPHAFWMKNTLIPLDIVFIHKDGKINHIHPEAQPHDLTLIPSQGPVHSVLEIKGGRAARLGIKPGDTVHHARYGNALAK